MKVVLAVLGGVEHLNALDVKKNTSNCVFNS